MEIYDRLRYWQEKMLLTEWTILLERKDMKSYGRCCPDLGTKRARIELSSNLPDKDVDWVMVHELAHLVLMGMTQSVYNLQDAKLLRKSEWNLFMSQYDLHQESSVDHIARMVLSSKGDK